MVRKEEGTSFVCIPNLTRMRSVRSEAPYVCTKFVGDSAFRSRPFRGRFMIRTHGGSVLYVCTKFHADCSILFKSYEVGPKISRSRDPGHVHLGGRFRIVYYSLRSEGPSSIFVPNLKRIAVFVRKL